MRTFTLFNYIGIFIFFLSGIGTINAQIVISKPNLGFTQACASPSFNTYNVTFSFSPESALETSNQFIVELSDGTGSFSNPTAIYTSAAGTVTTSPVTFSFSIPTSTAGEAFRIRLRSTAPASISSSSNAFSAYYKAQDTPFSINNLIASGAYCSGGSYLLTIDNPGVFSNDSPLKYPSLTFKWYKETSPTTSVFVADGETLSVNEPGTYFVETNYGSCTSNSFSNRVTVSEVSSGSTSNISSSLGNPYCSSNGPTVLNAINGNSYQWFKDGKAISGATSQMYETNDSGEYSVNIDLGNCMTNASINIETTGFTSSINVNDINNIDEDETLMVTVTTSANNPEYNWYLNDVMINGASANSYEVTQTGSYKVVITQTTSCNASTEFPFIVREAFPNVEKIPNLISPNGDGENDTWVIPQTYVSGTDTEVILISYQGRIELKTNSYQNNWPENQLDFKAINPIYYYIITTSDGKIKKGTITVVK
ncbi:MAG: gliding motility-associated C-terminal domain-containing protein [Algibacter sp.]|uniref:T9SS type B sorting domain-containing protein n=1 Tax=Algibacter sp. TaxID=1872428 RepID=UPI00261E987B|nr:gliding motility-associated C-terminal domain-containing protein [Algibacter sp.]MDG1730457.1 gliding motility-associated C-terminal domain-containing protein [Algibacter sp.]MDG2177371.1 gliding motility-associated C-terminal domain-containing protein [Algibacter sp.]